SNFNQYNQINLDVHNQILTPIIPTIAVSDDQKQLIPIENTTGTTDNLVDHKKKSRWIAPSSVRYRETQKTQEDRHNDVFRRCRGLLNKLTPEKFEKLTFDLLNIGIDSPNVLKGIILLIFEKSLVEPNYCGLYAELCRRLDKDAPNFEPSDSIIKTFRRLLLAKCEYEFENRAKTTTQNGNNEFPDYRPEQHLDQQQSSLTPIEMRIEGKKKAVGNIKFIGELGKLDLVSEAILHKCIKTLLTSSNNESLSEKCEDLECLTKIMQTIGKKLDNQQGKNLMDQYIERIKKLQANKDLPSRIRYILQDVIELRENNWRQRIALKENETKLTGEESINRQKQQIQQQQQQAIFSYPYALQFQSTSDIMYQMPNRPIRPAQIQNQRPYDTKWSHMAQRPLTQLSMAPARSQAEITTTSTGGTNPQLSSDRFQFERLYPISTDNAQHSPHYQQQQRQFSSSYFRPTQTGVSSSTSPKTRGQQRNENNSNLNLMNPFETSNNITNDHRLSPTTVSNGNKSKTLSDQTNGDKRQTSTTAPSSACKATVVDEANGDNENKTNPQLKPFVRPSLITNVPLFTPASRNSVPRPQTRAKVWLPTDREASQMIPLQLEKPPAHQINRSQTSNTYHNTDIVNNHPLTKQQSNLSSLIKTSIPSTTITAQLQNVSTVSASSLSLEELHEKYDTYLTSENNTETIVQQIRHLKLSKRQTIEFGEYLLIKSIYNHKKNIDSLCKLLQELYKNSLFTNDQCITVISNLLQKTNDHEKDIPLFKSEFSFILAKLISSSLDEKQLFPPKKQTLSSSNCLLSLANLCKILKDGQYHPLFLLLLQQLQQLYNNNEVYMYNLLEKSKINMSDMLPLENRKDDLLLNVLEDRRLAYLCPYLKLRCKLIECLCTNITSNELETIIDEQIISYNQQDEQFIQTLITCIYEVAIDRTTLTTTNIQQRPDKQTLIKEKEEIEKYRHCLQKYITTIDQQVQALYALQLLAYKKQFPKELLLRLFKYSYDLDIIDEDAYYTWKEDINDDYPEKGKALFQVNQWIKWLEGAEEESDSDPTTQQTTTLTKSNEISPRINTDEQQKNN
ncbi:unnamed protein product, partial [Didymodactylos carnosus]